MPFIVGREIWSQIIFDFTSAKLVFITAVMLSFIIDYVNTYFLFSFKYPSNPFWKEISENHFLYIFLLSFFFFFCIKFSKKWEEEDRTLKSAQHSEHPTTDSQCPEQFALLQKQISHKIASADVGRILKLLLSMLSLLLWLYVSLSVCVKIIHQFYNLVAI